MTDYFEYSLWNKLPEGVSYEHLPAKARWLYSGPFYVFNLGTLVTEVYRKKRAFEQDRRAHPGNVRLISGTTLVVKSRLVKFGDYKEEPAT